MSIKVAIVESDGQLRSYLEGLVNSMEDFAHAGCYFDVDEALKRIRLSPPDVVFLDLQSKNGGRSEYMRQFRETNLKMLIIMLPGFSSSRFTMPSLLAGTSGYLLKPNSPDQIAAVIRDVYRGEAAMAGCVSRVLLYQVVGEFVSVRIY